MWCLRMWCWIVIVVDNSCYLILYLDLSRRTIIIKHHILKHHIPELPNCERMRAGSLSAMSIDVTLAVGCCNATRSLIGNQRGVE